MPRDVIVDADVLGPLEGERVRAAVVTYLGGRLVRYGLVMIRKLLFFSIFDEAKLL